MRNIRIVSAIAIALTIGSNAYRALMKPQSARLGSSLNMASKVDFDFFSALLFDCDGVLAETERDVHRISFNEAFKTKGLTNEWNVEKYGELLRIGGGKERMTTYFNEVGWPSSVPEADRKTFIQELHLLKTDNFNKVVQSGAVGLRPGVMRLIDDALESGLPVAVCSTSNDAAVKTIVRTLLGERFARMKIFAGDIVEKKKPAPDVYLLAAKELGVEPSKCWVIEDSEIGCKAAKAAGMRCVVTKSIYTQEENFEGADTVISDLDKGLDGPITVSWLNYKASPRAYKPPQATANADLFGATPNYGDMFSKIINGKSGTPFG